MAKANDLFKKLGSPSPLGGGSKPTLSSNPKNEHAKKADENITTQKPDRGHSLHKPGKAQGGAGAPGGRPKV